MRRGGKGSFFPLTPSEVPVNFLPFVFCCPQTKPRTCEFRSAASKLCEFKKTEFKTENTMQKRSITLKLFRFVGVMLQRDYKQTPVDLLSAADL